MYFVKSKIVESYTVPEKQDLLNKLNLLSKRKISKEIEDKFLKSFKDFKGKIGRDLDNALANRFQNLSNIQLSILYLKYDIPNMDDSYSMKKALSMLRKQNVSKKTPQQKLDIATVYHRLAYVLEKIPKNTENSFVKALKKYQKQGEEGVDLDWSLAKVFEKSLTKIERAVLYLKYDVSSVMGTSTVAEAYKLARKLTKNTKS